MKCHKITQPATPASPQPEGTQQQQKGENWSLQHSNNSSALVSDFSIKMMHAGDGGPVHEQRKVVGRRQKFVMAFAVVTGRPCGKIAQTKLLG